MFIVSSFNYTSVAKWTEEGDACADLTIRMLKS